MSNRNILSWTIEDFIDYYERRFDNATRIRFKDDAEDGDLI